MSVENKEFWGMFTISDVFGENIQRLGESTEDYKNRVYLTKEVLINKNYLSNRRSLVAAFSIFGAFGIACGAYSTGGISLLGWVVCLGGFIFSTLSMFASAACGNIIDALRYSSSISTIMLNTYLEKVSIRRAEIEQIPFETALKLERESYILESKKFLGLK